MTTVAPPLALLAELTHRCPLSCPYCSNPLELDARSEELDTTTWKRVLSEAKDLGILQIHFSGGEPTLRPDLAELINHAEGLGLYCNLITAAVSLTKNRVEELKNAGLSHVQISFQGTEADIADRIAGFKGAFARKTEAARH
ncbi:MAG: radical SAM protein, partial [Sneathiella sp.]|nr:radical SAM protein [Sneathiella sp.]